MCLPNCIECVYVVLFVAAMRARRVFIVRALSPRDGGWVRLFEYFPTEEMAWEAVERFWGLLIGENYITIDVRRTIQF